MAVLRDALGHVDVQDQKARLQAYASARQNLKTLDPFDQLSSSELDIQLVEFDRRAEEIELEFRNSTDQAFDNPIQSPIASFLESLRSPKILLPNIIAAAVLAVMNISTALSVAALVFSGPMVAYMSTGIGLYLVGTVVGGILVAAASGYKAIIAGPRSGQAPIVASLVAGIVIAMEGQPIETIAATAIVAILASSIFISLLLYGLGRAKLGGMVRYIPYPVMGGFFAGLGFLLFKGGVLVSLGPLVSSNDLSSFMTTNVLLHFIPAAVFAVLLYVLDQRFSHWLLMPFYLVGTLVTFYLMLFLTGTSLENAAVETWLPATSVGDTRFLPVLTIEQFNQVDWTAVLAQSSTIMVMALMSVIMVLLDTSGVEIIIDRDLDPNHELKAAGKANLVNGLTTGIISLQSASDTAFTYKLGGDRFIMILAYGVFVAAVIVVGPSPIAYVPTLLLGGLLMYIGIDFLMTWVWYARKKLPLKDFLVVCVILFVVAAYGLLEGVVAGVIFAIILFVHSYSQLSVIKASLTGSEQVSNVDRDQRRTRYLDKHGDRMHIFVLQGFLFFGTASRLLEDIRALLDKPERKNLKFLLLDFKLVDAMDTSAANSFAKLLQVCKKNDVALIVTGCSPDISNRLSALGEGELSGKLAMFGNLDEGVAWCHDKMLERLEHDEADGSPVEILSQLLEDKKAAISVSKNFREVKISGGEALFRQGDPGDALYLIVEGTVSIVLELPDDKTLHLRTMRAGAILGEMALYTGAPRSASAIVNGDSVFYRLDQKSYKHMNDKHPAEASLFHSFIVRLISERLARANKAIMALSR